MSSTGLRKTEPGWLRIGGIGCALVAGVAVLLLGGITAMTFRGYRQALDVREELDRRWGAFDGYVVPADGTVPPDRMARFLDIRRTLMPRCAEVTAVTRSFARVDEIAGDDDPDVAELFRRVGSVIRLMPSIGFSFGGYVSDRNDALLERGMGLGEYTWLYVVGYLAYLEQTPVRVIDEQKRPRIFEDRVYPAVAAVIARHVAARGLVAGPWVEERARLDDDPARVPFRGTLPPELLVSLEQHRDALSAVACPAAAELDLTITVRRDLIGYDHR